MELDVVCIPLGVEIKVLSSIKSFKNPVKIQSDTIILYLNRRLTQCFFYQIILC